MIAEQLLTPVIKYLTDHYLTLENIDLEVLPAPRHGRQYMLYAHIPFCEVLCPYCSFNRFLFNKNIASTYYSRLRQELRMAADLGYSFQSMYIGGGTPTILIDELIETIQLARSLFGITEVSCETNPNHLTPEFAGRLEGHVQRLSVGVQSFNDDLLKQMHRYERFGSGAEISERIQTYAECFPTLNADMIFNFPSQTEEILREDVAALIKSGATQVSYYPLMSAPSVEKSIERTIGKMNFRREGRYYHILSKGLENDFEPSAAWTFSRRKDGMIDEYISEFEEYVGLGSGSFSYLDGSLYVNTFSLKEYDEKIGSGRMAVTKTRRFKKRERMRYRFMMELFGLKLDKTRFSKDFGMPIERGLPMEMAFMGITGSFCHIDSSKLTLSTSGRYLLVVMMREFFTSLNNVREEALQALEPDERSLVLNTHHRPATL